MSSPDATLPLPADVLLALAALVLRRGHLSTLASLSSCSSELRALLAPELFRSVALSDAGIAADPARFAAAVAGSRCALLVQGLRLLSVHRPASLAALSSALSAMRGVTVHADGCGPSLWDALGRLPTGALGGVRDRAPVSPDWARWPSLVPLLEAVGCTLDGLGAIAALRAPKLAELRVSWFAASFSGGRVPSSDEAWAAIGGMGTLAVLRIARAPTDALRGARMPPSLPTLVLEDPRPTLGEDAGQVARGIAEAGIGVQIELKGKRMADAWGCGERQAWEGAGAKFVVLPATVLAGMPAIPR
ncbi:hypothetical protein DFJ74DRAFT_714578 [Hyaloraphidium curvatum]|nr:hypothetical protein DFJ74DRAFT_714578 [Hyaloraphidium curvatum]